MVRIYVATACASVWIPLRLVPTYRRLSSPTDLSPSVALVPTTIVATIVVMTGAMTDTATTATGMTGTVATTGTAVTIGIVVTIVTLAMTVVEMTVLPTLANARGHLLAVLPSLKIVAPGRLPRRGKMIGGLQGTMIDEDLMMFGEVLTLILIAVGTNVGVTTRTNVTMTGHLEPTGIMVGDAE